MNTIHSEDEKNLTVAIDYYYSMLSKDFDTMISCLSNDIHLISPLAQMHSKEEVVTAAKKLAEILQDIKIRSRFASNNQVMLAYDMMFPESMGDFRSAVLMDFKNSKIEKIELFYDGRLFETKKNELFEADKN